MIHQKKQPHSITACAIISSLAIATLPCAGTEIDTRLDSQSLSIAGDNLGHACYMGASELGADYEKALSKLPVTTARLVVGYPAIAKQGDLTAINYRYQAPAPLQKDSTNREGADWYTRQELIRSPYFAALLYKAAATAVGKRGTVLLQPLYTFWPDDGSGSDFAWTYADRGLARTANTLVNTRVYSFGIPARSAIEDQRHEALTMGPYLTPAVAVSRQAYHQGLAEKRQIVVSRLGLANNNTRPTWSGGIPKTPALYESTRIKLKGDPWTTYLAKPSASPNPAKNQWADPLAKRLAGLHAKMTTPQEMTAMGTSWAMSMFGTCAADVAHRFSPDAWAQVTATALTAENQALTQWSDALYGQLTEGTYGTAFRAQMGRETDAILRYERARSAQGFMNFMSVFTAVATGAMQGYANNSGVGYSINNLQLSDQMFDYGMVMDSGTRARDSMRSSSLSALSELASSTAAPQFQAVTVVGANQQAITARNLSDLRGITARLIMNMSKGSQ